MQAQSDAVTSESALLGVARCSTQHGTGEGQHTVDDDRENRAGAPAQARLSSTVTLSPIQLGPDVLCDPCPQQSVHAWPAWTGEPLSESNCRKPTCTHRDQHSLGPVRCGMDGTDFVWGEDAGGTGPCRPLQA